MRTIQSLRNECKGKLYVFLNGEQIARQFLAVAQAEGYRFGETNPLDSHISDIIAVESGKRLAYVSTYGRIAFQAGAATGIDYEKYTGGAEDYIVSC